MLVSFKEERRRGALTLFGPGPPKAEGDEGNNDEDKGS